MLAESTASKPHPVTGRLLTGLYVRVTLWFFLGMVVLWLLGFESIYDHPTPFYALYLPAFTSLAVPGAMLWLMGLAYWIASRSFVQRGPQARALGHAGLAAGALCLAALAYQEATAADEPITGLLAAHARLLGWHLLAFAVFLAGLGAAGWVFARHPEGFARRFTPRETAVFLAAAVLFAGLFACAVAMIRGGPAAIAEPYMRTAYEYVGDIGTAGSIRALFGNYAELQPYLSLHSRAAPPGPVAWLWLYSYVAGREAMALALATVATGSLAALPLYFWVKEIADAAVARAACLVYVCVPAIVLFTATSADILFTPVTLFTLACFERAIRRDAPGWAVAAGLGFSAMALLKFTLIGVGCYFAFVGLWRLRDPETRMAVFRTAALMFAAALALHGAVWAWSGYNPIPVFLAAKHHFDVDQHLLDEITPRYPGWTYNFINPFAVFYFAGVPVSLLFLWRLARRAPDGHAPFVICLLTVFTLNLLYIGRGEVERSALFIYPFLVLPAAHLLREFDQRAGAATPTIATLAYLGFQTWLTESYFYTYW